MLEYHDSLCVDLCVDRQGPSMSPSELEDLMTSEEIEHYVAHKPFQPFRVLLVDGEEIFVSKPRKSLVSGDDLALVGICRRGNGDESERFRLISVGRVQSVEFLPGATGAQ